MKLRYSLFTLILGLSITCAHALTAFQARDLANREVNNVAKGKVIEIYGPKNDNSVLPTKWKIIFYDPYASQEGRMITVDGNVVTGIQDGYVQMDRMRLAAYKPEEVINPKYMKVDSDRLLDSLRRTTALKNVKISNLQMRLVKADEDTEPIWYVKIFALKNLRSKVVELGDAQLSPATGQILELKMNLKRLD
jgi:hypothetical protein